MWSPEDSSRPVPGVSRPGGGGEPRPQSRGAPARAFTPKGQKFRPHEGTALRHPFRRCHLTHYPVPTQRSEDRVACYNTDFPMTSRKKRPSSRLRIVARADLPTRYGRFTVLGVEDSGSGENVVVLQRGSVGNGNVPLVRIHSQCLTGDVLTSQRCDCRAQLELALDRIGRSRSGLLLYVPQEGRGIGLMNKLRAYELQDRGLDTVEANRKLGFAADSRDYGFSAAVLRKLGASRIRLLSNNPDKVAQLEQAGVRVVERIPCQPKPSKHSRRYLQAKRDKLGHILGEI